MVPPIDLGSWRYLTLVVPSAARQVGQLKRYGILESLSHALEIFILAGETSGEGRGGTTASDAREVMRISSSDVMDELPTWCR